MSELLTDVLIVAGAALIGAGLGLFDWRYAVLWLGLLCMAAGVARLPRRT